MISSFCAACSDCVFLAGKPETCASTTSSVLSHHFQRKALPLVGGAPCSKNQGYCDKFHVCRLLDADGPIARLKNSFLHLDDFEDLGEWMKVNVYNRTVENNVCLWSCILTNLVIELKLPAGVCVRFMRANEKCTWWIRNYI